MTNKLVIVVCGVMIAPMLVAFPQALTSPALARVNGTTITEEQVKVEAAADLQALEVKKAQADAAFARDRQALYELTLSRLVDRVVLQMEATKQGVSQDALMRNEIDKNTKLPTDGDVMALWKQNKDKSPMTEKDGLVQVRNYLTQQARATAAQDFIRKLRQQDHVETYLQPIRTVIPTDGFPVRGPIDAPITIVEFADFECPFCAQLFPTLEAVLKNYGDKVRLVYRQFPLTAAHPHAEKAAEAALCANDQHRFWDMHDAMFADNKHIEVTDLKEKAFRLGLNVQAFNECLDSSKYAGSVANDIREGATAGVAGTPALFINGRYLNGAQPYTALSKVVDEELRLATKTTSP